MRDALKYFALQVRIGIAGHDPIGLAYAGAAATGDAVEALASNQQETLTFNFGKAVTLKGGYDCQFSGPPCSHTTTTGSLTVGSGTITLGRIAIR